MVPSFQLPIGSSLLLAVFFIIFRRGSSYSGFMSSSKERPSKLYPSFFEELPSLSGKKVVVTGASRGLGYVTALSCAKKGAEVIMLCRSSNAAEQALAALEEACIGPSPVLVECDLLDFGSVRHAAAMVRERSSNGIDVLCCNAGIMLQEDLASRDGFDITMSTNVLSHFLLTRELIPELEHAANLRGEARIVSMSSGSGFGTPGLNPIYFCKQGGNLGGKRASYDRYHQSKLGNLIFTSALDKRLRARKSNIKALACTPGVCGTDMFVHATTVMRGKPSPRNSVPSTEDGSLAQLKCIADPSVQSGELWGPRMGMGGLPVKVDLAPPTVLVGDDEEKVFWNLCEEAVGEFKL